MTEWPCVLVYRRTYPTPTPPHTCVLNYLKITFFSYALPCPKSEYAADGAHFRVAHKSMKMIMRHFDLGTNLEF